jgi:hypothetical protein
MGIHNPGWLLASGHDAPEELAADGCAWVRASGRAGLVWDLLEPAPGVYDWSAHDALYAALAAQGLGILATVRAAARAYGDDMEPHLPRDMEAFLRFLALAVERYDGDGQEDAPGSPRVSVWQIGNEPDGEWRGSVEDYAALLVACALVIRTRDPSARIAVGGIATPWGYETFFVPLWPELAARWETASGGSDPPFDVVDLHWSGQFDGASARSYRRIETPGGSWDLAEVTAAIRSDVAAAGLGTPAIWITEASDYVGSPARMEGGSYPERTEVEQAASLVKRYAYALAVGVERVFWVQHDAFPARYPGTYFDHVSLLDRSGTPRLAHEAYRELGRRLAGGVTSAGLLQDAGETMVVALELGQRTLWVAWRDGLGTAQVAIPAEAAVVAPAFPESLGVEASPDTVRSDGGSVRVAVGTVPVYIESFPGGVTGKGMR